MPDAIEAVHASKAATRTKLAFEMLVLTAVRSNEIRGARWDEIDLEAATWTIPDARMKMERAHSVPLTARVINILREARDVCDGSDLVFAGSKYGRPMSDATILKLVRSLGFAVDIHGFRSSFRTWAAEQTDVPREVAEHALAHAVGSKVEQAYNRSDLFDRRRALMNDWAAYCRNGVPD